MHQMCAVHTSSSSAVYGMQAITKHGHEVDPLLKLGENVRNLWGYENRKSINSTITALNNIDITLNVDVKLVRFNKECGLQC